MTLAVTPSLSLCFFLSHSSLYSLPLGINATTKKQTDSVLYYPQKQKQGHFLFSAKYLVVFFFPPAAGEESSIELCIYASINDHIHQTKETRSILVRKNEICCNMLSSSDKSFIFSLFFLVAMIASNQASTINKEKNLDDLYR